jgi:hypothetical protein
MKQKRNRSCFGFFRFEPKFIFVCFEDTLPPGALLLPLRPLQLHVVGVAPAHRLLRQLQRLLLLVI